MPNEIHSYRKVKAFFVSHSLMKNEAFSCKNVASVCISKAYQEMYNQKQHAVLSSARFLGKVTVTNRNGI